MTGSARSTLPTAALRWVRRVHPVLGDAVLPALLLLNAATTRGPQALPLEVALTAALSLPLLWRRRSPLPVFGAVAAAAGLQWLADVQLPADVALLIALYTAAAHTGRRTALLAAAVVEVGALLACLRWAPAGAFLTPFVAVTAMVVAATALGLNVRTNRAYLGVLEERAARLVEHRDQQARLAAAGERTRIAREMHDIVTHNLSVMVALTDAAVLARPRAPEKADAAMLRVAQTGRQALADMRRALGLLRTDEPDADRHPPPGHDQLRPLAEQMTAAGLPTRLHLRGGHTTVPASTQLTVYRLVQEALTNTLKHAPAGTEAEVRIDCSPAAVTVEITDTGTPSSPPPATATPGHGLTGMGERAAAHGGTVRSGPRAGGGWTVHAHLPLQADDTPTPTGTDPRTAPA
ncbi:sensor histidine kinase [Kitasatospora sp. NPDC096147]|uniref:sensor histidine kinase n=1 Tax=Kitasatospora sp. NPDC096147 TaxID=3364093 RepID=UPI00382E3B23